MPRHTNPCFELCLLLNLCSDAVGCGNHTRFCTESCPFFLFQLGFFLVKAALCNGNNGEILSAFAPLQNRLANLVNVIRNLRNQNDVCTAGNSGIQGQPAGFVTHDFTEQNAGVAVCSCVQTVDRIRCNVHCGMESKGNVCSVNVVVNGLWQADDVQPLF